MLVKVDTDVVTIYLKSKIHVIPSSNVLEVVSFIRSYAENKQEKVYYIKEIEECSSEDIYHLLSSFGNSSPSAVKQKPKTLDSRRWLHATGSGYLNLANFTFDGPTDLKALHELDPDILQKDHQLRNMIKRGLVRIVDSQEIKEIRKVNRAKIDKFEEDISSIVLDTSVKSLDLKNMSGKNIDAEIIDESELTGEDFETEEEKIARSLGLSDGEED